MDAKNVPLYQLSSILRSPKNQLVFLNFTNEAGVAAEETIAITYPHAYQLAMKILTSLHEIGYEEAVKHPELGLLIGKNMANNAAAAAGMAHGAAKFETPMTDKEMPKMNRPPLRSPKLTLEEVTSLEEEASLGQLQKLFSNGSPDVRLQVVRVLARRRDPAGVDILLKGAQDNDVRVKRLSTDALGYFPSEEVISTLLEQIKDADKVVKLKAVESLAKIGDRSVAPALAHAINDPSVTIRRSIAELLGTIGDSKIVSVFSKVLKDDDEQVRLSATKALMKIGGPVAASVLSIAMKDANDKVRESAARALGEVGNAAVVPILLAAINFDEVAEVREGAADALGRIGDASAHKPLQRLLKDESEEDNVRCAIARAIGRLGNFADVPVLISLLRDPSGLLRVQAVLSLGRLKDNAAIPALQHVLTADNDAHVREAAVEALGDIGDKQSFDLLQKTLRDKNAHVRTAAAKVLAKFAPTPELVEILQMLRDDPDDYVRYQVVQTLEILQKKSR